MSPVERARSAVGARFRLHGRDPASGLDCVGLAAFAYEREVAGGYALRGGRVAEVARRIAAAGLVPGENARPDDLLLLAPGPGQLHLVVWTGAGIIHADAMLRRVVERPGPPDWPVLGRWRLPGRD